MWKFENSTATHVLREVKFGNFGRLKPAILAIFEALDFDLRENSILKSVKNSQNAEIRIFELLKTSKCVSVVGAPKLPNLI